LIVIEYGKNQKDIVAYNVSIFRAHFHIN